MSYQPIRELVAADLASVDALMRDRLSSDVPLINQLSSHIIGGGGKRLRPVIVLLSARACGYRSDRHPLLAAIIELIHTATLLHDDVVDDSQLRRGQTTANARFGNAAAVLVGDFVYSRAFQMMTELHAPRVMTVLAECTNTIAAGEVMQLMNCRDADATEAQYMEIVYCKTAKLFEAGARLSAIVAGGAGPIEQGLADYGKHLGIAFQLIDDVLDYQADSGKTGKNIGDDLAEGKPTLPLIQAMRAGAPQQTAAVRSAIESGGLAQLDAVIEAIESTHAIAYTAERARQQARLAVQALDALPPSPYRQGLEALAEFSVRRNH